MGSTVTWRILPSHWSCDLFLQSLTVILELLAISDLELLHFMTGHVNWWYVVSFWLYRIATLLDLWCHLVIFGFTIPILQTLGTYCLWPFVDLKATFFLHLNSTWEDSEDSSFPLAPTITVSPTPELLSVLIVVAGRFPHLVTLSESSQPK